MWHLVVRLQRHVVSQDPALLSVRVPLAVVLWQSGLRSVVEIRPGSEETHCGGGTSTVVELHEGRVHGTSNLGHSYEEHQCPLARAKTGLHFLMYLTFCMSGSLLLKSDHPT